jgi:hypothetical protein
MHKSISILQIRSEKFESIYRINAESALGVSLLSIEGVEDLLAAATLAKVAMAREDIVGCLIARC